MKKVGLKAINDMDQKPDFDIFSKEQESGKHDPCPVTFRQLILGGWKIKANGSMIPQSVLCGSSALQN